MHAPSAKLWALAGVVLAACGLTEGEPCGQEKPCFGPMRRPEQGQVLVYNNGATPQHLDPGLATGAPDGRLIDELFEGLMDYHPKTLKPVPGVAAEKPTQSPDGKTLVFKIRPEAVWSNGDPVTAHDFVYSWERVLNPVTGAQYSYILFFLKNAELYTSEMIRVTTRRVTLSGTEGTPEILEEGKTVLLEESNAARIAKDEVRLSASAGAAPGEIVLEKDQVVLVSKNRQELAKPGAKGEKELWVEVTAYPDLDLESAEDVRKNLSGATARTGWLKAEDIKVFFPSSNRRVVSEQVTLKRRPDKDAPDVLDFETRKPSVIGKYEEVRILQRAGEWTKVYWPKRARYGYLKSNLLLDPWGELYQYRVRVKEDSEAKEENPPPPTPASAPAASAPTSEASSAPVSLPASEASSEPASAPAEPPSPPAVEEKKEEQRGWLYAKDILLDPKVLGFRAIDDRTLEVRLENPTPYFLTLLAHYTYRPIHPATFEDFGNQWTKPENIVVNGPFKLEEYLPRDKAVLVPNETYWDRENVTLKKIVAYMMDNLNTTLMMYKAGYTDLIIANDMPTEYIPVFYRYATEDQPGESIMADFEISPALTTYFYRINVTRKPLDDVRVRKALAMAIDRSKVPRVIQIPVVPADSVTPPGIPESGYNPPDGPNFNPEEARRLLAEAGYPGGKGFPTISILFNTQEQHKKIAEFVQEEWRKNLGIQVNLANKEWKTYLDSLHNIDYDIARAGWIADYLDPMTFLDMWVTDGGNNNTGWSNPEYDALIKAAQSESDQKKRIEIMTKMETMLNEEIPIIPIYTYVWFSMTKPYVKGIYPNMIDKHPLKWACIETSMLGESDTPVCDEVEKKIEELK